MTRALTYLFVCICVLTGCSTQRVICPAYQSAFIFDKPTARSTFVHYNENKNQPQEVLASNSKTLNLPARDSSWEKSVVLPGPALPFERKVKKERYLLLPKRTYKQALRALQTVPMKPVYPKKEEIDSLAIKKALDSAARSITDTLSATAVKPKSQPNEDSVAEYVITKEKEKFNLDQDNYMWYFRDILVLPDVRIAIEGAKAEKNITASKGNKKGFFAKLKGLFKKKPKQKPDTTTVKPVNIEENYEVDLDSTAVQAQSQDVANPSQPVKKKGGLFKKKSKTPKTKPAKPEAVVPVKKPDPKDAKKEESDGF